MPLTIAPDDEAMSAITTRINAGTTYTLAQAATYGDTIREDITGIGTVVVDVLSDGDQRIQDTLNPAEDRQLVRVRIWVRKKLDAVDRATIEPLKLLVQQIANWVNAYDGSRVRVWSTDTDFDKRPNEQMIDQRTFVASIVVVCSVNPS
jgi:hypothetical protein